MTPDYQETRLQSVQFSSLSLAAMVLAIASLATPSAFGQWVANFSFVAISNGVPAIGGVYNGPGVVGTGTNWNIITNTYNGGGTRTNTTAFADDGTTSLGIRLNVAQPFMYAYGSANLLLDSYAQSASAAAFSFTNIPNGTYNLVLFGVNGEFPHADRGTTFTVNGQTRTTTNSILANNASFVEWGNYVQFVALTVTNMSLSGTYQKSLFTTSGSGYFNGLQLQYNGLGAVAPIVSAVSPSSLLVAQSVPAQFSASVSGYPAPGVYWQFSTNGNPPWINVTNSGTVSGANSSVLTLASAQPGQAGYYQLVATNSAGAATSSPPAQLMVHTNSGANYYVSTNGSDSNTGTSWAQAWKTIKKGITSRLPGDVVNLAGGQTFSESVLFAPWVSSPGGVTGLPVTLTSDPANRATIQQTNTSNGVHVWNTGNIVLQNLVVIGLGGTNTSKSGTGVNLISSGASNLGGITVSNLTVSGFGAGINAQAWDTNSFLHDVLIVNCQANYNFNGGGAWAKVLGGVSNIVVRGCEFNYNYGDPKATKHSGSGFSFGGTVDGLMEWCIAHDNGGWGTNLNEGPVGLWCYDSKRITVQYCESYNNRAQGKDGDGFDIENGTSDSVFQYCYSHGNFGTGYLIGSGTPSSNNILRYCISENDGAASNPTFGGLRFFGASGPVVDSQFYNNVVYSEVGPAVAVVSPGANIARNYLRNNIFITASNQPAVTCDANVSPTTNQMWFQGNAYWIIGGTNTMKVQKGTGTYYTNLSDWRTATGQEKLNGTNVGYNVNPLLVNPGGGGIIGNAYALTNLVAYKLQTNSPMIGAGLNLAALFGINPGTNDFYGTSIPQNGSFDIGVAEYVPVVVLVATTTTVTSSTNPSVFGQSVTFTATVAPGSGQVAPTGAVQFKVDGTPLGSAVTVTNAGGINSAAVMASSALAVAGSPHVITAEFSGSGNFLNSTNTLAGGQTVVYAVPIVTNATWVAGSGFQLSFSGPVGQPFRVLGTNLLTAPLSTWPVLTNGVFGPGGVATFTDVNAAGKSQSYYRVGSP